MNLQKLISAIGLSLFVFGLLAGLYTFVIVRVLGAANGWWQAASSLCFIRGSFQDSSGLACAFLNYDQVFIAGFAFAFVGLILWRYFRTP